MRARKIKLHSYVLVGGNAFHVLEIGRDEHKMIFTGRRMSDGHRVRYAFWDDDNLPLCNPYGVLIENVTEAEVRARSAAKRMEDSGWQAKVKVSQVEGQVIASVFLNKPGEFWEKAYYASWSSRTEGRKTTAWLSGTEFRPAFPEPSKRTKSYVTITQRAFARLILLETQIGA